MSMQWSTLYSAGRTGSRAGEDSNASQASLRTSFVRDYDRLIFSSAFRRLQNKTQVFPLPGAVFVHNRLTHSLEVASVGRSLGKAAGDIIAAKHAEAGEEFKEFYKYELPSVIAAACLAHDIGNPPFGHSGEEAIRTFFAQMEGTCHQRFQEELNLNQQRDFLFFEGNANAFRTLTHHFNENMKGGFRLTYATLASIVKYPCNSGKGFNKQALCTKKSGFFDSEWETYKEVARALGIPALEPDASVFARHPFVYLVEAADDICYRIIDLEDAHRLGIISLPLLLDILLPMFDEGEGPDSRQRIETIIGRIVDENQKVQFLRAKLINLLIQKATSIFETHEADLLAGTLSKPLLDYFDDHTRNVIRAIDQFSVTYVYNHRTVIEIELAGYNVIGELLKAFTGAVFQPGSTRSRKLLQLIPAQFPISNQSLYHDLQSVVDFVAGMTDLYAMDMYRKLTGMNVAPLR